MKVEINGDDAPRGRTNGRAVWVVATMIATAALVAMTGCNLGPKPDLDKGQQLFTQKCGSCHTLTGAGTNGTVGPNLDYAFKQARANGQDSDTFAGVIKAQVENPRPATPQQVDVYMPPDLVTGDDLDDVAAYVASVAGVPGIKPPVFSPPQFFATNCGGCHTLAQAGTTGTTGPNLDEALPGQGAQMISQDITDPNAVITPGYQPNVMPQNFGQTLTPDQLQQLVAYLQTATGGGGGGAAAGGGGGGKK
ncbi:MAG TPA: c-type cytochrome [Solirubrobacterales bacterium]|nr:c-type cytochrome [Solirubrobacterales bacterium]